MNIEFVSISYSASDFYSAPSPNLVLLVIHQRFNQSASSKIVKSSIKKLHNSPVWNLGMLGVLFYPFGLINSSKICKFGELVFSLFFLFLISNKCAVHRSPTHFSAFLKQVYFAKPWFKVLQMKVFPLSIFNLGKNV